MRLDLNPPMTSGTADMLLLVAHEHGEVFIFGVLRVVGQVYLSVWIFGVLAWRLQMQTLQVRLTIDLVLSYQWRCL